MGRTGFLIIAAAGILLAACAGPATPAVPDEPAPESGTAASLSPLPSPTAARPASRETQELPSQVSPLRTMAAPAIADLAGRLGVAADSVEIMSAEEVDWPDASLGCPAPDLAYAQVVTNGMRVTLQAGGRTFEYHGRSSESLFLCGPDGPVAPGEVP